MTKEPMTHAIHGTADSHLDVALVPVGPSLGPTEVIPRSEVVRGALTRFLPGGALVGLLAAAATGGLDLEVLALLGVLEAPLALGYFAGLELLRRRLRSDAEVVGRKSLIAGVVAPLVLFCTLVLVEADGVGLGPILLWASLSGFATATVLFFPWLRSSEERGELEEKPAPSMIDWNA